MSHKTPQTRNPTSKVSFASPLAIAWMHRMRTKFPERSDEDLREAYRHFMNAEQPRPARAA